MFSNQVLRLLRCHRNLTPIRNLASNSGEIKFEKSLNEVRLLGRAGVEAKKGGSDTHPVVYFSLATQNNFRSTESGEMTQKTDWHRVVIFKPSLRDSVYNYLQKGQRVYVAGRLSYGEITDASGQTKPTTAVIADDVIFFQNQA